MFYQERPANEQLQLRLDSLCKKLEIRWGDKALVEESGVMLLVDVRDINQRRRHVVVISAGFPPPTHVEGLSWQLTDSQGATIANGKTGRGGVFFLPIPSPNGDAPSTSYQLRFPSARRPLIFAGPKFVTISVIGIVALMLFVAIWLRPPGGPALIAARLIPQTLASRSSSAGDPMVAKDGVYWITSDGYEVQILNTRAGYATLILHTDTGIQLYPKETESDIRIEVNRPYIYGPLIRPSARAWLLVVITPASATKSIREFTAALVPGIKPEELRHRLTSELGRIGVSWIAFDHFELAPPDSDSK